MPKAYLDPGPLEFEANIYRNGEVENSSAFVKLPYDLKETLGVGNLVPIKATFDKRVEYRGSLVKMGGPHAKLLLRKDVNRFFRLIGSSNPKHITRYNSFITE